MAQAVDIQGLSFAVMTAMAAMLYGHTPTPALVVWYAVSALLCLYRMILLNGYGHHGKRGDKLAQTIFFIRYTYLDPIISFSWGFSVYLFSDKAPANMQTLCLVVVAAFGIFSVTYLSSHLRLLYFFLGAYTLGLLSSIAAQIMFDQAFQMYVIQIWFVLLAVLFVLFLKKVGTRMNHTYIKSMKLQYRNKQLIDSLTQQTQAALSAVATKNRLLASAAHDMRQPVLALDIYADWLVNEPTASPELSPKISVATKAVIALFDSLFDMAKLTEGQIRADVMRVDIKALMEDLMVQYHPLASARQLSLRTRFLDCDIWTDPMLLRRILGNLISNAIKYTQTGGILLACRHTRRGISFEVWDTGVGIAPEQQHLVFREFYKGPTHAGTSDGFGLGLAIVTQLSGLLGCELTMKSRLGRGTVVSLQFDAPASARPSSANLAISHQA